MNDPTRQWHPFGRTEDDDLNILKNDGETGWWDDNGRPAPWPSDFLDPDAGWVGGNTSHDDNQATNDPENPPF